MGCLYQLTSPSGKSYLGISSKGVESRWKKHVEHALGKRDNGALYAALRKYGHESFSVKTLAIADDWNYLCELEKKAISAFNTLSPGGYNMTAGGEGAVGRVTTDQARINISNAQKLRFSNPEQRKKLKEYGIAGAASRTEKLIAMRMSEEKIMKQEDRKSVV
jgi:group I intron endonuclease